jgi:hypothetical protein
MQLNNAASSAGVRGENISGLSDSYGVHGIVSNGNASIGVFGISTAQGGVGVKGEATGTNCFAVWGYDDTNLGYAGFFSGHLYASAASATIKAFKIDHPLYPESKYLYHSSVESPDMMNVYNGNITTDGNGEAIVTLPSYFPGAEY